MKLVAIVGTNADFSYNRKLLEYMKWHFRNAAEIELLEVKQLPPFNEDLPYSEQTEVWRFNNKVNTADGVIIATPEYDHSIPAALKSGLEWLSYKHTTMKEKPVMIVGVSYGTQGTSRAQQQLRQMLLSPDLNSDVLPGSEVLIGNAAKTFDKNGFVTDINVVHNLEDSFAAFNKFVRSNMRYLEEGDDNMTEPHISSEAKVQFRTGSLKVKEIQQIFNTLPFEIDFIDDTDHFAYYSDKPNREHVRYPNEIGETVEECHPPKALPGVRAILDAFKLGTKDHVERCLPLNGHKVWINYFAVRDENGRYLGTMEFTGNVGHLVNLVKDGKFDGFPDATSGASKHDDDGEATGPAASADAEADATTGASEHDEEKEDKTE
ncbi:NAD(P)H-dependent oxidoreductase [Companilactobacillus nodensis]|uniref:NADPH-dependent FMN reductase n=1 Tax=Companilactobacillus nodensis DSM 19682 = JCM 14932 = NBRC 107160 TaxID=1423775 RepID=A0A0R1KCI0_9LACO|nr:NAD(P)H-dependent oxidoreductase [Companilactobacillus nodensis]KRK81311.1 NADPH-dependent FMN reductase [Companilactobacillus nodensis DSM 19682 = JCM 14932 = NBRC 107160]